MNSNLFVLLALALPLSLSAGRQNSVVATLPVGVTPDGLAITCDSRYAYVVNNNNYGINDQDNVTLLDLKKNIVKETIYDASFNEPFKVAISPDGKKVYVPNSNSTTLSVIDTEHNIVTGVIGGFDGPSGIAITPNGKYAYVNNYGGPDGVGSGNGTTVSVVDLETDTIIAELTVGQAPAAVAMAPNGKYVYVINYVDGTPGSGTLSIIKTKDNSVTVDAVSGLFGPFGIAITPNGKYAYVTNFGSNDFAPIGTTVSVIRLKGTPQIVDTIDLAIQPSGIAITPNGRYAYVSNYNTLYAGANFTKLTAGDGIVNIIDLKKNRVVAPSIRVGHSPNTISIAPNGKFACVTNFTSGTVDVIQLTD